MPIAATTPTETGVVHLSAVTADGQSFIPGVTNIPSWVDNRMAAHGLIEGQLPTGLLTRLQDAGLVAIAKSTE